MIDLRAIRSNPAKIKQAISNKGYRPDIVDEILQLDSKRSTLMPQIEQLRAQKNRITEMVKKQQAPIDKLQQEAMQIKKAIKRLEPKLKQVTARLDKLLLCIPNLPAEDVPVGKNERANKIVKKWGKPRKFTFRVRDHLELGELLDIIDVRRAAKVSGTRFGYLKNEAVLLEFALVQFALHLLLQAGFKPVIPPVLIKLNSMRGMGYLEHGGIEDMFVFDKDQLVLVGTAEQSIGPMHMKEVFAGKELPRRYVGFSTCFRREAGAYGKDTRGILRVHQFDKLEMFSFVKPEAGDQEHQFLLSLEEQLLQKLQLPYQVVQMCTGDLGAPAARKYDLEAWFPSQNKYRELTSASTTTDFQARRLNIKFREGRKTNYVHMLNATAIAMGRTIIAILENYQQKDGSVSVPEALRQYIGKAVIKPRMQPGQLG